MEVRYTTGKNEYRRMTTEELRAAFLNTKLYEKGKVNLMYCEVERGIAGFAVPTAKPLALPAGKELASDYFCERRELGVLNIGGMAADYPPLAPMQWVGALVMVAGIFCIAVDPRSLARKGRGGDAA